MAAVVTACLIAGVAAFQLALAMGAPYGGAVLGGRAPTRDGVLTVPFRVLAVVQAALLVGLGLVFLARADLIELPWLRGSTLVWITWIATGMLLLNTLGNFGAPHPIERWVMGPITLVVTVLGLVIAFGAS